MSTKSRQTIYGGPIMGAKIRAEGARKRAAEAAREADRAEVEAWSLQMEAYGGPAQPSPTIGQCVNGGLGWLEVECKRCKTRASLPLDAIRRPRNTPIWKLEAAQVATGCLFYQSPGRGAERVCLLLREILRADSGRTNVAAQLRNTILMHEICGTERTANFLPPLSVFFCEVLMTFQATEGACAFAWRNYLLVHSGISEDDHRRSALHRYLTDLGAAGVFDFDTLQIAAISYLKSLDELHDDRGARLAADKALAERVHSRAA